jgi:hypothetical protein
MTTMRFSKSTSTILIAAILLLAAPPVLGHGFAVSVRSGTSDPATCQPTGMNVFINRTSTPVLKVCTAANTWAAAGGSVTSQTLTTAAAAVASNGVRAVTVSTFTWAPAQLITLGGGTSGNLKVATLPAKTVITNAYIIITVPDGSAISLTVSLGRTGANYTDYIVASNAKAAANTVYGDAGAERSTNLTGYDLPSWTAATDVYARFVSGDAAMDELTSEGVVVIEHYTIP